MRESTLGRRCKKDVWAFRGPRKTFSYKRDSLFIGFSKQPQVTKRKESEDGKKSQKKRKEKEVGGGGGLSRRRIPVIVKHCELRYMFA